MDLKIKTSARSNQSKESLLKNARNKTEDMRSIYIKVAYYSVPNILTMLCFCSVQMLTIWYMGNHYSLSQGSETYLAGVGLGNMMLNVFVFALTQGLNSAIDTFVS